MVGARWPLVARVPALTAALVLVAALVMSAGVLVRLSAEQEAKVSGLARAYLDTTAAASIPSLARQDVWEAFDILDRGKASFSALRLRLAVLLLPDGSVLAATDPRRLPVGAMPDPALAAHEAARGRMDQDGSLGWMARDVIEGGRALGRVLVEIDLAPERAERVRLIGVMMAANAALAVALALAAWWTVATMLRPVRVLTARLAQTQDGAPLKLPGALADTGPEFRALVASLEEREALAVRLAEEERLATLGMLAGSMAHEVNNPLGGMMTALDTIAAHDDDAAIRAQSVGLVRRGLEDIRNVVGASLVLYKAGDASGSPLTRGALDDLRLLAGPEAARRGVNLDWDNRIEVGPVDATPVRQIVLNLLLNAIAATPSRGVVRLSAGCEDGKLWVRVSDQGSGLPPAMQAMLSAPGAMPVAGSTGLGLWTAVRTAHHLGGRIVNLSTRSGTSLTLELSFGRSHAAVA